MRYVLVTRAVRSSLLLLFSGSLISICSAATTPTDAKIKNTAHSVSQSLNTHEKAAGLVRRQMARQPINFFPVSDPKTGQIYESHLPGYDLEVGATGMTIRSERVLPHIPTATPAFDGGVNGLRETPQVIRHQTNVEFVGANHGAQLEALDLSHARVNRFIGKDSSQWQHDLPTYARVRSRGVYPGIDLVYYGGGQGLLEYDLVVAPHADLQQIRFRSSGDDQAVLEQDGSLDLDGKNGSVRLQRPVLYQDEGHSRKAIVGDFVQLAPGEFGFRAVAYDHDRPLIVDPAINLVYATYAGGIHNDLEYDMTLDATGNAYVVGESASQDFPVSGNAYQTARQEIGTYSYDAVILKFDASGNLLFSTFLGGSGNDEANTIAVSSDGSVIYVGGDTNSSDFPVTSGAYQKTLGGGGDAFLARLSNDGSQLLYSTYLGGTADESIQSLILNSDGSLWIAGDASGPGLPVSATAAQKTAPGADDNFVAKAQFDQTGALSFPYLTFLGGSGNGQELGHVDMSLDSAGNVYVGGGTTSADYPVTTNAYEKPFATSGGCYNTQLPNTIGTLTKFSPDLSQMLYSTVIGGHTEDQNGYPVCNQFVRTVHVDLAGHIWLVGTTGMADFPTTSNAISKQLNGNGLAGVDSFVSELSADGTQLLYSSYFGGSQFDYGARAAWDSAGHIWLVDTTQSPDYPVTSDALQPTNAGGYDTGVTEFSADGTTILYSTYLGGSGDDDINGSAQIKVDAQGNVRLTGTTSSTNYPVTGTAVQPLFANGDSGPDGYDLYYTVLGTGLIGTVGPASGGNAGDTSITISGAGFTSGAFCELVQGPTILTSTTAVINATGTSITCTFALGGAITGSYDVVVVNPNGTTYTKTGAFTVNAGTGPSINVDLVGRPAIRVSTETAFTLAVSNTGDSNAYAVMIQLSYPTTATLNFNYSSLPKLPSGAPFTDTGISQVYTANGMNYQYIFMPVLATGSSNSYSFKITDATYGDSPTVTANWGYASPTAAVSGLDKIRVDGLIVKGASASPHVNALGCFNDIVGAVASATGVPGCVAGSALSVLVNASLGGFDGSLPNPITNGSDFAWWLAQNIAPNCAGALGPIGAAAGAAYNAWQALGDCGGQNIQKGIIKFITTGSLDPNFKSASSGDGSANAYIIAARPIPYDIGFENEATATAPAAAVVVTDQLDGTKVSLSQLSLGPITFGTNTIAPPTGSTNYSTTYTPPGVTAYKVRIQGSLNADTGLAKWTFQTIDPTTGLPPTDPSVGFLPPDSDGVVGQGSVSFNIMPVAGQSTGTQITNTASIVFDSNAAISTATTLNTLDVDPPVSKVTALPATITNTGATTPFTVSWSGTDKGSGIASYSVYVSDNGGAYTVWQAMVTATSAIYSGQTNHTYGFYTIAIDKVGNVEAAKSSADTTTVVEGAATTTTLATSGATVTVGTSVTFTATVSSTTAGTPTGTVTFMSAGATLGSGPVTAGVASYSTSALTAGTYSITAVYSGDTVYAPSTSAPVTETIQPPSFTMTASPSSLNLASGASGSATISLSPTGGFAQAVSFTCSGLPAHATCSFAPSTVTLNGTAISTTTVSIATNIATLNLPGRGWPDHSQPRLALCFLLFGGAGLLGSIRIRSKVRRLGRMLMALLFLITLPLAAVALLGCGNASPTASNTPPGTSIVTITGNGGGQTQTVGLTITVQ